MSKRPPPTTHPNPPADAAEMPIFNPVSKWQEHVEVPGLTLFDIHREPRRENVDPDARVRVQLKVLGPEFHCPVCLGYIKNTRIVKECLHRFCNECIEKCLRIGKKECPQCRIHIPSRRSLRPDTNFDELINSLYGDIEKLEKYEEAEIKKLNKKNMNNAYAESRKRGILHQAEQRKKRTSLPTGAMGESTHHPPANRVIGLKESHLIEVVIRRHPQETTVDKLKKEYIRTSQDMTVERLKIFLGKKLGYSPSSDFQIMTIADDNAVVLPNDITLALVRRDICDNPMNEIILHYRIFPQCKFASMKK
eukprot:CAMPEP_0172303306 /NCGR_PEP_ID=MMETSP1058-20130122/4852_1 /TAXON_ID=83371 /ORGANISM="Detonula confervacea, Strain CCMP 353" /LENGTH=306 /DNA_ID=CAMNT_0013014057 /DNA_START=38 /DNA_END=958 /DNA_ORIENTATION=-